MPKSFFAVFITIVFLLTGCSSSPSTPMPTATPQPTRILAYEIDPPTRTMTRRQAYLKDSDFSITQWNRIQAWLDYWIKCDNPPFDPAVDIRWDIIWDNPGFPFESYMVIDYEDAFYAVPAENNQWLDPPATACQGTLDSRYTPLLLASGEDRQWLRVEFGSIVQRTEQGDQVDILFKSKSYEFDAEKLSHVPASYEYLRDHPDEFVQAPDPWMVGVDVFHHWINDELEKALGDLGERVPNVIMDYCYTTDGGEQDVLIVEDPAKAELPIGPIDFFFFTHNGINYPVYLFVAQKPGDGEITCTIGVVLVNYSFNTVPTAMQDIYRGDLRFLYAAIWHIPQPEIPDEINSMIYAGFGRMDSFEETRLTKIGFGGITYLPAP